MIVAGCDVGSLTAKAVVLNGGKILGQAVIRAKDRPEESAQAVFRLALDHAGIREVDLAGCVGTGYGRNRIPFVSAAVSEITCHARGAQWLIPGVRTVIDVGGQDCKAIRIGADGKVANFITNDKCAAGTGRFLEVMAGILSVDLAELGLLSERASTALTLSSTCTVWAQAEVIQLLNADIPVTDIGAAVNEAMANRVSILARAVGVEREVCMTGGVAKNVGVVKALERLLGTGVKRLRQDPQIVGALGAAVIAREKCAGS
ncbi:MAG: acyl-CoA dehydratase activase [Syntrophaceae bacterium]